MTSHNTGNTTQPYISADQSLPELTLKVIIISVLLALILAAANCYLALKIGTTIAASIPASVMAIGILRFFKNSNILESNMIQTAASAGEGVAASISFVLPGMILLHYWDSFPYWETVLVTSLGGVLGVLFSVPLRRVLLNIPALRFPEGTAIGKVLTSCAEGGGDLRSLSWGAAIGGIISFCQTGLQVFSDSLQAWFRVGNTVMGVGIGFNPALVAAGYIIGIGVCMSILTGIIIGWVITLPILFLQLGIAPHASTQSIYHQVMDLWGSHLRYIGVGVMFLGGIWTLLRLVKPLLHGIKFPHLHADGSGVIDKNKRTERDIPNFWIVTGIITLLIATYFFLNHEVSLVNLGLSTITKNFIITIVLALIVTIGFLLSAICGYITGLVGSSNNPLSGILIIAISVIGSIFLLLKLLPLDHYNVLHMLGMLIIISAIVATCASITNENIQDLKAGQIIGATPWKQQVILILGVVSSSFIIAPTMNLLFHAYGMGGIYPHAGMDPTQMLPAPQASLIASVAKGILTGDLPWTMIFLGMGLTVLLIIVDEKLKTKGLRLPVLAVGLGIYLPTDVMTPVVLGGIVSYLANRKIQRDHGLASLNDHHQNGMLLACGLVAGASIMGVLLAIPFVMMGSSNALSIMPHYLNHFAIILGFASLVALCRWLYATSF